MGFENIFNKEREFINGENLIEWDPFQFHYYFASLQYLYFNGLTYTKYNKLFQPIAFGYNSYTRHCMLCISTLRVFRDPTYRQSDNIEDFILSNYAFFENELRILDKSNLKEVSIDNPFMPSNFSATDNKYFAPLIQLYKEANKEKGCEGIDALLLTNSLVDMGYHKGFSDADMVLILNNGVFKSHDSLKSTQKHIVRLLKYLYYFDPLQHHGFFVINAMDRLFYPEANYPLLLFDNVFSFYNSKAKLEFYCRNDRLEKRVGVYKSIKSLYGYLDIPNKNFSNLFLLKRYISTITLLPALYSQLRGGYIYKKEAFEGLKELFGPNTEVFKLAEEIRSTFPSPMRIAKLPFFVHPSIINHIHGSILRKKMWFDLDQLKGHTKTFLDSFVSNYAH